VKRQLQRQFRPHLNSFPAAEREDVVVADSKEVTDD
jgi:hypothetical protein